MKPCEVRLVLVDLVVLAAFALTSCAPTRHDFQDAVSSGRCEEALERIPENTAGVKLVGKMKQGPRTLLSYAFTGAGYTAEIAWDAAGRTTMFVALCGPGLALAAAAASTGGTTDISRTCMDGNYAALDAPELGQDTFANTKDLRCPDVSPLSRSVQQVASCYRSRKDADSLQKARSTLVALKSAGEFYSCLSPAEKTEIEGAIEELDDTMASMGSGEGGSAARN